MAVRLEMTSCVDRPQCFCCINQVVVMLTRCLNMTKAVRSLSKQGHLEPCCHVSFLLGEAMRGEGS